MGPYHLKGGHEIASPKEHKTRDSIKSYLMLLVTKEIANRKGTKFPNSFNTTLSLYIPRQSSCPIRISVVDLSVRNVSHDRSFHRRSDVKLLLTSVAKLSNC